MDSLTLSATTSATSFSGIQFFSQPKKSSRILNFPFRKPGKYLVFASKDESKLDEWDQMELKFGRMIGEDPKITLTKIMGRKINPDLSYLEIEKLLDMKKGKAWSDIEEVPFDVSDKKKSTKSVQGVNLIRPVPKEGTKFEAVQGLNLVRPVPKKGIKFEATNKPVKAEDKNSTKPITNGTKEIKSSVPSVILRKPSLYNEDDDDGNGKSSRFGMKPNLSIKMGKAPDKERFSDMTLLKKPEPLTISRELGEESGLSESSDGKAAGRTDNAALLQKPELKKLDFNEGEQDASNERSQSSSSKVIGENNFDISISHDQPVTTTRSNLNKLNDTRQNDYGLNKGSETEMQAGIGSGEKTFASGGLFGSTPAIPVDTVLIGKPKRLDRTVKAADEKIKEAIPVNPESLRNPLELDNLLSTSSPIKEREYDDWDRAEKLVKTGDRDEVELISSSTKGFVVSFGSLIGFLPYRNLAARWKFLAFESWLRRKGIDPSIYRQNLGVIGYEATSSTDASESVLDSEVISKTDGEITSDMKLEDLFMIYDQEKLKFLSSFVGQV